MNIDMNINNVYMVRSAKGIDMLCVDDYLYHYDGRGRADTFRWLCNRRKDKRTPCRSRISTILSDPRDITVHVVHEVHSEHTHERCSDHEITKVSERKRIANLRGEPCTLLLKRQPRKPAAVTATTSMGDSHTTQHMQTKSAATATTLQPAFTNPIPVHLDFVDKDRVYILRRRDGRVMCCIDGQLYYLEGKSVKCEVYRWACVRRRDVTCTAYVLTEPTIDGTHRLRPSDSDAHIHLHYSKAKLLHMFQKHNISSIDDDEVGEVMERSEIEYFDIDEEDVRGIDTACGTLADEDEESIIIEDYENMDAYEAMLENSNDAELGTDIHDTTSATGAVLKTASRWPYGYEVVDNFITPPNHNPLKETDLDRFTFLPSAKGKKVLCMNRYLYHYDSQSKANGHMFWTCIMRRVKSVNCHVRVTMDPTANGPIILRITGQHNHPINLSDIKKRLRRRDTSNKPTSRDNSLNTQAFGDEYDVVEEIETEVVEELEQQHDDDAPENFSNTTDDLDYHLSRKTHLPLSGNEMRRKVVLKKVLDIDGIKLEPNDDEASSSSSIKPKAEQPASMVVEYMQDGSNNISAKIEILPTALQGIDTETTPAQSSTSIGRRSVRQAQKAIKQSSTMSEVATNIDLTKICKLRSAKGSELLCVDGYIYHSKNKGLISRSYWVCIKARDPNLNCKSRISTAEQKDGSIRVLRVYNNHSHPVNENDIKRRLYNEINKKSSKKLNFRPGHFIEKSLDEITNEYGDLAIERLRVTNVCKDVVVHKAPRISNEFRITPDDDDYGDESDDDYSLPSEKLDMQELDDVKIPMSAEEHSEMTEYDVTTMDDVQNDEDSIIEEVGDAIDEDFEIEQTIYSMKLYAVSDGPPSLAVRMTLKAIDIQYQLINVDFCALEHRSEAYAKMNPQKEIPVLDDDGFFLSESVAIMQYLCDKYAPNSRLYPHDPTARALINQRLCFNLSFYYAPISAHTMAPIFFDYERTPMTLLKVQNALECFETYLQRAGTRYAAASNDLTIADLALVSSTLCLEAIGFDLTPYPLVAHWYADFKQTHPQLWEIANSGMQEIIEFEKNPPDLTHMDHPFHPTRRVIAKT